MPGSLQAQLEALLEPERAAKVKPPSNFKDDALTDKIVSVNPGGTGLSPIQTFDTHADRQAGSGTPKS